MLKKVYFTGAKVYFTGAKVYVAGAMVYFTGENIMELKEMLKSYPISNKIQLNQRRDTNV